MTTAAHSGSWHRLNTVKLLRPYRIGLGPTAGRIGRRDRGTHLEGVGKVSRAEDVVKAPGGGGPSQRRRWGGDGDREGRFSAYQAKPFGLGAILLATASGHDGVKG